MRHVEALPIDSDMSDHALILFSLEVMRPHAVRKTITFRSYRNVDNNSIVNDIEHLFRQNTYLRNKKHTLTCQRWDWLLQSC